MEGNLKPLPSGCLVVLAVRVAALKVSVSGRYNDYCFVHYKELQRSQYHTSVLPLAHNHSEHESRFPAKLYLSQSLLYSDFTLVILLRYNYTTDD